MSPVAKVRMKMSALPDRVETNANRRPSGEYIGRVSLAAFEMRSRASPPAAGTVQMSPPETNAISDRSGEIDGSAYEGRGVGVSRVVCAIALLAARLARAKTTRASIVLRERAREAGICVSGSSSSVSGLPKKVQSEPRTRQRRLVLRAANDGQPR